MVSTYLFWFQSYFKTLIFSKRLNWTWNNNDTHNDDNNIKRENKNSAKLIYIKNQFLCQAKNNIDLVHSKYSHNCFLDFAKNWQSQSVLYLSEGYDSVETCWISNKINFPTRKLGKQLKSGKIWFWKNPWLGFLWAAWQHDIPKLYFTL